jgi:hypothetical protein
MKKGTLLPSQFECEKNSMADFANLCRETDKAFEDFSGALSAAEGRVLYSGFEEAVRAAAKVQARAMRSILGRQAQSFGFLKHRYEQQIKLVDNLANSRDLTESFMLYADFSQKAVLDYAGEMRVKRAI